METPQVMLLTILATASACPATGNRELNPGIGGIGGIGGLKPLSSPGLGDASGSLRDDLPLVAEDFYYYVRDYQGNIRAVLDEENNVVESNSYYPYGMPYADNYTSVQPYKYGGKELDRANGLDMYDFHARQYDPAFPCFTSIDELCEKYPSISPYAYCMGNPINAIDPDGRRTWRIREDGSIYDYSDKNKSFDAFVIVDSKGNTKTDYSKLITYYKRKLIDYGALRELKNACISEGKYTKKLKEVA